MRWLWVSLIACCLAGGAARAEDPCCITAANRIYLGPEWDWQSQNYSSITQSGSLWGLAADFDYLCCRNWYIGANLSWVKGDVGGNARDVRNDLDIQARLGYTFCLTVCGCRWSLAPYAGFGYRELDTTINNQGNLVDNYQRYYAPIGVRLAFARCSCWDVGLNVQARIDVGTSEYVGVTTVGVRLKREVGVWLEVPIAYHFCPNERCGWDLRLVPFFKWDRFGQPRTLPTPPLVLNLYDGGLKLQLGYRW